MKWVGMTSTSRREMGPPSEGCLKEGNRTSRGRASSVKEGSRDQKVSRWWNQDLENKRDLEDQVLKDKRHPKKGVKTSGCVVRTSRPRVPQEKARATFEIKGDFEVVNTLEDEISSVKVRVPRGWSQEFEGKWEPWERNRTSRGLLMRESGPQE